MNQQTLQQIYTDFTNKLLPAIQQGSSITKDYILNLFGRYIKYLIIMDSILLLLWTTALVIGVVLVKKQISIYDDLDFPLMGIAGTMLVIMGMIGSFIYLDKLMKDLTVPEVRIYEELKGM